MAIGVVEVEDVVPGGGKVVAVVAAAVAAAAVAAAMVAGVIVRAAVGRCGGWTNICSAGGPQVEGR